MANCIVSYDLNGSTPTHAQVDQLLERLATKRGRVLETVWWMNYPGTAKQLYNQVNAILRAEDRLLVCECNSAAWRNLLVNSEELESSWIEAA